MANNNPCMELLKDGVFAKHNLTKQFDKTTDYKDYFQSDKFRSDYKDGNIDLSVGVVIEGVPIDFGFGKSDTEITGFQEKVRKSTSFQVTEKFYIKNAETFGDKTIIDGYNNCLSDNSIGLKIRSERTETEITFIVRYINYGGLDEPVLESVYFSTGKAPVNRTLNDGSKMNVVSEYSFTFALDDKLKEGTFIIDTTVTQQSLTINLRKRGGNSDDLPVGSVITSFLDWKAFQKATDCNKDAGGLWKAAQSYWCPCDGRPVPGSLYEELSSQPNSPDLRGVFLRGMNIFDVEGEMTKVQAVNDVQKDVDTHRTLGSFQPQDIQSHTHSYFAPTTSSPIRGSGGYAPENPGTSTTGATGGSETRPKNIAVNYYVRIN